jgi:hypothetical protein
MTHDVPAQQSALSVHCPHAAMHAVPEHTKGGEPPATGLGTHGTPPQQLALDAHEAPAATHCAPAQRGTPMLSCLQVSSVSQLPLQQSHDELQDIVLSLHTSPSGLQPIGLRQMPSVAGAVMSHVTAFPDPPGKPAEPQQSPSFEQRSPTTWHPLAGWQTSTPVGPQGAHARLQQGPPHAGKPAALIATPPSAADPPQICPSTTPQLAGPLGGLAPQVPSVAPAAIVHPPVQQSDPIEQASPPWPQNDEAWHVPFEQSFEQQSAPDPQALPRVLHVVFRAAHMPAVQVWLQQSPFVVQAPRSDVHAG